MRTFLRSALLVIAAAFGATRAQAQDAPAAPDDAAIEADRRTLRALREAGADLTKPTEVNFYVYVPSEAAARRLAQAIEALDLTVETRPAADGNGWLCLATTIAVPELEWIGRTGRELRSLAAAEGGEYDGWEAAVTP